MIENEKIKTGFNSTNCIVNGNKLEASFDMSLVLIAQIVL